MYGVLLLFYSGVSYNNSVLLYCSIYCTITRVRCYKCNVVYGVLLLFYSGVSYNSNVLLYCDIYCTITVYGAICVT